MEVASNQSRVSGAGAAVATTGGLFTLKARILKGENIVDTASRSITPSELVQLESELNREFQASVRYLLGKTPKKANLDLTDQIVQIIRRASISRAATGFGDPYTVRSLHHKVATIVAANLKLIFFLPLGGGKAPSVAKVGHNFLPDLTEDIQLIKLAALATAISQIYGRGASVIVMPDAPLHSGDLGFATNQYRRHLDSLRIRIDSLGLKGLVDVIDTIEYLPPEWDVEVRRIALEAVGRKTAADEIFIRSFDAQVNSLQYSINTREYSWSLVEHVLITSAQSGELEGIPPSMVAAAHEIKTRTALITPHYIGVNGAIRSLHLAERIVRSSSGSGEHVRLTVHAKPGEPRPLLTQLNSLARPMLLPMHSLAYRYINSVGEPRFASVFYVEAVAAGWTQVVNSATGGVLFYEASNRSTEAVGKQVIAVNKKCA